MIITFLVENSNGMNFNKLYQYFYHSHSTPLGLRPYCFPQVEPQCHIVPLFGEGNHKGLPLADNPVCRGNPTRMPLLGKGNHKGLPLHYITVCRGNPTCKALSRFKFF